MKVKICGVTSVEAALACARAGAEFVGLNFYPRSVRYIEADLAREIVAALPEACTPVGVFVNRAFEEVDDLARRTGLRWVQLHGDETPSHVVALRAAGLAVIKAYRIGEPADLALMTEELTQLESANGLPEAVLIDARGQPGQPGGTGRTIPSTLLTQLPTLNTRLILAGGLTPENVAERIQTLGRPELWMVDTASGAESEPGQKDPARIQAFVAAARRA